MPHHAPASEVHGRRRLLRRIAQAEELPRPEAERPGDQVRGELRDLGVEVADHGVVVAAGVLDVVLDLGEAPLEREEALGGLEIGIRLGQGEDLPHRLRELPFGLAGGGRAAGARGPVAGLDHGLQRALLVARVALDRGDEGGDQIVPPLELDVDVGPGVGGEEPEPGQAVVGEGDEDGEGEEDEQGEAHGRPRELVAQTASDRLEKVKSRIRIGGTITRPWVCAPCTRTGRPSASRLLSMITGDSLNRKFLIA